MLPSNIATLPVLTIISLVNLLGLLVLAPFLILTIRHYRKLTSKVKKKDLRSVLDKILTELKAHGKNIEDIDGQIEKVEKDAQKHLQKVGFVRFNPFSDTGGDQSFCLSILDEEDSGIVLSSLHSRGQTRLYAKSVKKGKGKNFDLSKEEVATIKKAKKGK
jgi:hypothetical protein